MESSFTEYRDKTGVDSGSDDEIIDNSLEAEESFNRMKTPGKKNRTVFVPESDESSTDDETEVAKSLSKAAARKSSVVESNASSSEDGASRRGSIRHSSSNRVVLSSSEEAEPELSPELLPKRRPPMQPKPDPKAEASDTSVIGRRKNKRMVLLDSDTDNSIIVEHNKHNKLTCLKDTPLKIDVGNDARKASQNDSIMHQSDDDDDDISDDDKGDDDAQGDERRQSDGNDDDQTDESAETDNYYEKQGKHVEKDKNNRAKKLRSDKKGHIDTDHDSSDTDNYYDDKVKQKTVTKKRQKKPASHSNDDDQSHDSDDSNDDNNQSEGDVGLEDQLVMSRATRMSIMGIIPKGGESDDSDYIVSDEQSRSSSATSNSLPDVSAYIRKTPETQKPTKPGNDLSTLTCSPFSSPLRDVSDTMNQTNADASFKHPKEKQHKSLPQSNRKSQSAAKGSKEKARSLPQGSKQIDDDVTFIDECVDDKENLRIIDEDLAIIDTKPEIIALSSDDDDEVQPTKPTKKSPRADDRQPAKATKESTMKQYLLPTSYPNQVVYVKKHVLENELSKLESLKQDLHHLQYMMDHMDMRSLPDGGKKLIERLSALERQVRAQGDKVATFIVEPDQPTAADVARDGFEPAKPSWDDLQKASNAVQPRMFGKQAMATHMAERNVILERLRDLHASLDSRPAEGAAAEQPAAVRARLMPHQLHALAWLRWRETQRPAGGILADDMGLGKTIQMLSLIVGDKEGNIDNEDDDDDDGPARSKLARGGTLVVCPASLIQQWAGELKKHCAPHAASVCLHHGAARATHPHRLATNDLVITTYNILQRDNEKQGVLMKIVWRRIILDEAHIVRNHKSATSTAVSALKGKRRWCLTGTPVHNKDLDLFALLKFLRCTPFDELTMWKKWIDNKSSGGQERLNTIMQGILLRRTKAQLQQKGQLACLPTRTAHQEEITLDKEEMNVYQKVLVFSKTLFAQFLHQRAEKQGDAGAGNDAYYKMHKKMIALQGAKPVKSHEILVLLLRLRQVCSHCGLIAAMLDGEVAESHHQDQGGQDLLAELNKLSLDDSRQGKATVEEDEPPVESTTVREAIRSVLSPQNPVFQLQRQSSKIRAVMACLTENVLTKGEKAVVVSQWTSVLQLVEAELRRVRVRSVTLSGAVPVPARAALVDALNDPRSDVKVMLLSLCAGGVGLNLCGANHLLLLDPHWNPQLEEQAQDRIYRVGQDKPVHIYRFMCVDTVEQSIRKLQQAKLELAENVLTGAKNTNAAKLTIEDLKMLFNMGQSNQV